MTWPSRILVVVLLLIGAYEASRSWLDCLRVGSLDALYGCTVVNFDIHHLNVLFLLLGAAWLLITGVMRAER